MRLFSISDEVKRMHRPQFKGLATTLLSLVLGVCHFVACPRAEAKCVVFSVTLEGKLAGGAQQEVLVRIHTNRKREVIEERSAPAENDAFTITIAIDAFVSAGLFGSHNCSRRPKDIEVILLRGGEPVQTAMLRMEQDFNWDATRLEWRTKVPVVLRGDKSS